MTDRYDGMKLEPIDGRGMKLDMMPMADMELELGALGVTPAQYAALDARVQANTDAIGALDGRLDGMDAEIDGLDDRVDALVTTPVPVGEIIAEEIIDARAGEASLRKKIDLIDGALERQSLQSRLSVAQTARNQEILRPLVSFLDDDGYPGVLTKLKPLFVSRGVPMGIALMGSSQVVTDPEKRAEVLDLQNNHGWEILSHTMAHMDISLATKQEYDQDCSDFIKVFSEYGFSVQSIAYPWGKQEHHREVTAKYFSYGFGTGANHNDRKTSNNYALNRYGLGNTSASFADFKALIDNAKANNLWLIFMTHVDDPATDMTLITDVLDYVISQEIEVVTPSEGARVFGSTVASGRRGKGKYFNIKPEGYVDTNAYALAKIVDTKLESDPPEANVSHGINRFTVSDWSVGAGSVIEVTHASSWEYQLFFKSGSDARIYMRKWTGAWKPWFKIAISLPDVSYTCTARTIPAHSTVDVAIYDSSAWARHQHIATPAGALESGIVWNCWSHGNGAIRLRLTNVTSEPIELAERVWKIARFDTY